MGLRISRGVAPLLILYVLFNVGGMLSLTVMDDLAGGPMYIAVSLFLALSSVFFAAIIEAALRPAGTHLPGLGGGAFITSFGMSLLASPRASRS